MHKSLARRAFKLYRVAATPTAGIARFTTNSRYHCARLARNGGHPKFMNLRRYTRTTAICAYLRECRKGVLPSLNPAPRAHVWQYRSRSLRVPTLPDRGGNFHTGHSLNVSSMVCRCGKGSTPSNPARRLTKSTRTRRSLAALASNLSRYESALDSILWRSRSVGRGVGIGAFCARHRKCPASV